MTLVRSPVQVRVAEADIEGLKVRNPELLAPLARAIHNGKCPACGAPVMGLEDVDAKGQPRVQITCMGDPAHAFYFAAGTGHIADQPSVYGEVRAAASSGS